MAPFRHSFDLFRNSLKNRHIILQTSFAALPISSFSSHLLFFVEVFFEVFDFEPRKVDPNPDLSIEDIFPANFWARARFNFASLILFVSLKKART